MNSFQRMVVKAAMGKDAMLYSKSIEFATRNKDRKDLNLVIIAIPDGKS